MTATTSSDHSDAERERRERLGAVKAAYAALPLDDYTAESAEWESAEAPWPG